MAELNFNIILIGIVAVIGVAVILALLNRYDVFNRSDAAPATEKVKRDAERSATQDGDYTIPFLKRHKRLTAPAKLIVLVTNLLVLSGFIYVFSVLKNGNPVEVPYANAIQAVVISTGGIVIARWQDRRRGKAHITYEDDDGQVKDTETVYYDPREVARDKDGDRILSEHKATRLFGLFSQRKLTGDDRELRGNVAMMDEVVKHSVPPHADELAPNTLAWRTQGQKTTGSETAPSHYVYSSPIELPYARHVERLEKMDKMETMMDSLRAQLGEAWTEVNRLRRKVDEDESDILRQRIEEISTLVESLPMMGPTNYHLRQSGPRRHPQSQDQVNEMDTTKNGSSNGQQVSNR